MRKLFTYSVIICASFIFSKNVIAQIVNIPDAIFKTQLVSNAAINTNLDTEIQVSEAAAYTGGIFVGTQGITDLTGIEAFTAITDLDVSQNNLASVDLSQNVALLSFNCQFNSLTCLDLSHNTALTFIDCSDNTLTSLNLKNGNNGAIVSINAIGAGSMLYCVQVDNVTYSASNWISFFDTWSSFNVDCGQPTASFTNDAPVCFGTPVTFNNTSTLSNAWDWDFGDGGTATTMSPIYTYPSTGSYTATLIAKNCYGADTVSVPLIQGTNMYGTATYSLGTVNSGVAILYPYQAAYTSFDTLQIQPLDAFGNFIFGHVAQGNYLVQIFPDTILYPNLLPTYYTSDWAWDSASIHVHDCINDSYPNVTMVELTPSLPGTGYMQGYVIEGPGFGRAQGDPVPGVVVKRGLAATSQIVETTFTDANGQYTFNNLEYGTYTIYVDITGLQRDSVYTFTLDATTNQFPNLYYVVDSTSIYIVPGIGIEGFEAENKNKLDVFPNPVKENTNIVYTLYSDANVQLEVYNVFGIKVQSLVNTYLASGEYTYNFSPKSSNLRSGIYFISLIADGKRKTNRIVVME